eukprot:366045-Chlamydomonas_euryale.AAC.16
MGLEGPAAPVSIAPMPAAPTPEAPTPVSPKPMAPMATPHGDTTRLTRRPCELTRNILNLHAQEGPLKFYTGFPTYIMRIGPHVVFTLVSKWGCEAAAEAIRALTWEPSKKGSGTVSVDAGEVEICAASVGCENQAMGLWGVAPSGDEAIRRRGARGSRHEA